jgi:NAD+ diphosphatase
MALFVPSFLPPADVAGAGWIYFRAGEVWLDDAGPVHAEPAALMLAPAHSIYLGTLGGRPCFAAEISGAREGASFVPLRSAFLSLEPELFGVLATGAELLHFERTHRFCARCAGPLAASSVDRAKRCEPCSTDYYPRISPAVIVLVHDGPRVLLTHVRGRPFWALVAGFLEAGETLEQCAAREVREETGVAIDDLRYAGSQPWPFPSQLMVAFRARYAGGEIAADGKELDAARWFAIDALPPVPPKLSIARRMIDAYIAEMTRRGEALEGR